MNDELAADERAKLRSIVPDLNYLAQLGLLNPEAHARAVVAAAATCTASAEPPPMAMGTCPPSSMHTPLPQRLPPNRSLFFTAPLVHPHGGVGAAAAAAKARAVSGRRLDHAGARAARRSQAHGIEPVCIIVGSITSA